MVKSHICSMLNDSLKPFLFFASMRLNMFFFGMCNNNLMVLSVMVPIILYFKVWLQRSYVYSKLYDNYFNNYLPV